MKMDDIKARLGAVTIETLKNLAFVFAFAEEELECSDDRDLAAAEVSFRGPFSGKLMLTVTEELLEELSSNMLGAESEEISPDQQKDALKEATNVVCGNFLPEIAGPEAVFHIDAPVLHPGDYTVECGEGPYICVPLNIEEEPCSISFCADARILEIQWPEGRS